MQTPSHASSGLGEEFIAVNRRQEWGGRRRKEEEEGGGVPVLLHRVAKCVCVSVLTLSKSICPLWNCGHREGKRCPNTTRTHAGRKQQLHQQLTLHFPLHGAGGEGGAVRQAELMRDLGGWVTKQVEALLQLRGDKLAGQSMSEQKGKNQLKGAMLWVPSLVEICHCTKHAEEHCKIPNSVKIKTESELSNVSVLFGYEWISYCFNHRSFSSAPNNVTLITVWRRDFFWSPCVWHQDVQIWIKQVKLISLIEHSLNLPG